MPSAELAPGRTMTSAGRAAPAGPANAITRASINSAARAMGMEGHLGERTAIPPSGAKPVVRASGQSAPLHQAGQWPSRRTRPTLSVRAAALIVVLPIVHLATPV